jgi:antitoxin (DNA-binding transcriptional repressor) of toxin-antitoxin stability system
VRGCSTLPRIFSNVAAGAISGITVKDVSSAKLVALRFENERCLDMVTPQK